MGGISSSKAAIEVSATLVFSGVVRLENNGGFATITGPAASRSGDDLSDFDSIALRVKGDGNIYQFWLYTGSRRLAQRCAGRLVAGANWVVDPVPGYVAPSFFTAKILKIYP